MLNNRLQQFKVRGLFLGVTLLIITSIYGTAQVRWKTLDMTRTTDAFTQEVPVGVKCIIVETYGANRRFDKVNIGALKSRKEYVFDDNGYYIYVDINDGEKTCKNTYSEDGLIQSRDLFKDGEFVERWIYEYCDDEKGPGVVLKKYDANGESTGKYEAWQGNLHTSGEVGVNGTYILDDNGRAVSGTITITNYRQRVEINHSVTYNDHGFIESSSLVAPGRNQLTNYTDYVYDDNGRWIERYSNMEFTKRQILSEDEYEQILEQRRIEAERMRREQLARETEAMKSKIEARGYALVDELYTLPVAEVSISEVNFDNVSPIQFAVKIPDSPMEVSWNDVLNIHVKTPAQLKFPNDDIENVPSVFCGTIKKEFLRQKKFSNPIEFKIDFNKKTNEWYIKNVDKLTSKYNLTTDEVDALSKLVKDKKIQHKFDSKKLYIFGLYQLCFTVKTFDDSAIKYSQKEVFPISFFISDNKK